MVGQGHSARASAGWARAQLFVVACAALARAWRYFDNRPLWGDEAKLALNIVNRDAVTLATMPLDYGQSAPPLFLVVERTLVVIFGNHELVLRAFPFAASLGALWLFSRIVQREFQPLPALLASLCFAIVEPLVFYGQQYVGEAGTVMHEDVLPGVYYVDASYGQATAKERVEVLRNAPVTRVTLTLSE